MANYGVRSFYKKDIPQIASRMTKILGKVRQKDVFFLDDNRVVVVRHEDQPIRNRKIYGYAVFRYEHTGQDGWSWVNYGNYTSLAKAMSRGRRLKGKK